MPAPRPRGGLSRSRCGPIVFRAQARHHSQVTIMRFTDLAHLGLMLSALALAYAVPFELSDGR